ncbi:MAG: hypothetical protein HY369_05225 [Candidatus Aenigmarchaeota archaeon]|nr:hypothetical protein [Candidatus Aenigmarchaeota archaeon]
MGIHFYQRTDRHRDQLTGREREVQHAVERAAAGIAKPVVRVHASHVHVFASVPEARERFFANRVRAALAGLPDVRWDAHHYLFPVASLRPRDLDRLLEGMHQNRYADASGLRRRP